MVSTEDYIALAMSFEGSSEEPHFEKKSFRVAKKIFATLDSKEAVVCVKLNPIDQSVFVSLSKAIYPVPNKWGKNGWTYIALKSIEYPLLKDALTCSYCEVAPKKLAMLYKQV